MYDSIWDGYGWLFMVTQFAIGTPGIFLIYLGIQLEGKEKGLRAWSVTQTILYWKQYYLLWYAAAIKVSSDPN